MTAGRPNICVSSGVSNVTSDRIMPDTSTAARLMPPVPLASLAGIEPDNRENKRHLCGDRQRLNGLIPIISVLDHKK